VGNHFCRHLFDEQDVVAQEIRCRLISARGLTVGPLGNTRYKGNKETEMNKLIKMVVIVAGAGVMLGFAGCGGSGPDKVAVSFVEKLNDCDFDGSMKYASPATTALIAMMKDMPIDEKQKQWKGAKVEVVNTKIDGDRATVVIKRTSKSGKVEMMDGKDAVTLVKQDGQWKVDLKKEN